MGKMPLIGKGGFIRGLDNKHSNLDSKLEFYYSSCIGFKVKSDTSATKSFLKLSFTNIGMRA